MSNERWFAEGGTVLDENRLPVAHVVGQDEDNSDALLIAAAPAMLAALRMCHAAIHQWRLTGNADLAAMTRACDEAEAAISEAQS